MQLVIGLAIFTLASCAKAQAPPFETPSGAVVLPGDAVDEMLGQCSRDAPAHGEATWIPSASEIDTFERRLVAELPRRLSAYRGWKPDAFPAFPSKFDRQYVGIVRGGRKFLYGNFALKDPVTPNDATRGVILVCDGGPVFFGVEYDVAAQRFTHWGFNGSVG